MDKRFDIHDVSEDLRALIGECELTGNRTTFLRNERPVAILISHDEYLALRETIDIADDAPLRAAIEEAETEVLRGAMLAAEDLLGPAHVE
jgi:PHD/YefM family antitoxin component YafN of YafNO toxin-antitoxin module